MFRIGVTQRYMVVDRYGLFLDMAVLVSDGGIWVISDQGAGGDKSEGVEIIGSVARKWLLGDRYGRAQSVDG